MSSLLEKWACVSCILPGCLVSACPGKLRPDSLSTLTSLLSSSPSVTVLCVDGLCSYLNTLFLTALIWCSNSPQFGLWEPFWLACLLTWSCHCLSISLPSAQKDASLHLMSVFISILVCAYCKCWVHHMLPVPVECSKDRCSARFPHLCLSLTSAKPAVDPSMSCLAVPRACALTPHPYGASSHRGRNIPRDEGRKGVSPLVKLRMVLAFS